MSAAKDDEIATAVKNFFSSKDVKKMETTLDESSAMYRANANEDQQALVPDDLIARCPNLVMGEDVLSDIEMFKGYRPDDKTLFVGFDHCKTRGGSAVLRQVLSRPTSSADSLKQRQRILQDISNTHDSSTTHLRDALASNEACIDWVFLKDASVQHIYDIVCFSNRLTNVMNHSEYALTGINFYKIVASPIIGLATPIVCLIAPYYIITQELKLNVSFAMYIKTIYTFVMGTMKGCGMVNCMKYASVALSILFYFQGLFNTVEMSKLSYRVTETIHTNIRGFVTFIQAAQKLNSSHWNDDIASTFVSDESLTMLPEDSAECFKDVTIEEFGVFSNFGKTLKLFKTMDESKFKPLILRAFIMDALLGINDCSRAHGMAYAKLVDKPASNLGPTLHLKGLRHPSIEPEKVVRNNLMLGTNSPTTAILTGPNAGGKSTLLKAVIVNIMLAQTTGMACCDVLTITPFTYINSQIHIPDSKGKESLFEAEMHRCKRSLEAVARLGPSEFAFVAMDEVFNSTNPVEGIAGAYAIIKSLANRENTVSIVTTHYAYLTKLSKAMPSRVSNYKMNVEMSKETIASSRCITFPYKLTKGVSKQHIALELLLQNGFDHDIVTDALEIKNRLVGAT